MSLATANRIIRKFGGKLTEKGELIGRDRGAPRRYFCGCNPNGFVAGQVIKHYRFCPFHPVNVAFVMGEESTAVRVVCFGLIIALNLVAATALTHGVVTLAFV